GYDTINSTSYFVIPDSTNGNYQNLKNTSNVNVPGRWAFNAWAAPAIFYLFGSAAGDTEYSLTSDEGYVPVSFSIPYTFFGNTYNSLYVRFHFQCQSTVNMNANAGYDTINSIYHFVIPDSTNGNYQNLKNTTNVNVPGRWAFIAGNES
ncbi:hypothetical protein cypCar_00045850, partial [Cyprinus carpio]